MINFLHKIKLLRKCGVFPTSNGMTIIELVVVLAIFAVLSTVAIFSYGGFEAKVDITNLANDIALQVVQAQNSALSGLLPPIGYIPDNPGYPSTPWKPSYGVYFSSTSTPDINGADSKDFIYFADLDNNNLFNGAACPGGECISKYTIKKNNYIIPVTGISVICPSPAGSCVSGSIPNLTITFSRPSSGAVLYSGVVKLPTVSCVQITVASPNSEPTAFIKLYPSGRVQISGQALGC